MILANRDDLRLSLATLRRRKIFRFLCRLRAAGEPALDIALRLNEIQTDLTKKIIKFCTFALLSVLLLRELNPSGITTISIAGYKVGFPSAAVSLYGGICVSLVITHLLSWLQVQALRNRWGNRISRKPHLDATMLDFYHKHDDLVPVLSDPFDAFVKQKVELYRPAFAAVGFVILPVALLLVVIYLRLYAFNIYFLFFGDGTLLDRTMALTALLAQSAAALLVGLLHYPVKVEKNLDHLRWGFLSRIVKGIHPRGTQWVKEKEK